MMAKRNGRRSFIYGLPNGACTDSSEKVQFTAEGVEYAEKGSQDSFRLAQSSVLRSATSRAFTTRDTEEHSGNPTKGDSAHSAFFCGSGLTRSAPAPASGGLYAYPLPGAQADADLAWDFFFGAVVVNDDSAAGSRSEEHTSELQSLRHLVC